MTIAAGVIDLSASVINLISSIIAARKEGVRLGDKPNEKIDFIVRGFNRDGNMIEEKIMTISSTDSITNKKLKKNLLEVLDKFLKPNQKL